MDRGLGLFPSHDDTPGEDPELHFHGLSQEQAEARLRQFGHNELPANRPRSPFAIALEVIREPMFLLLLGAGSIYLLLGDVQEALMLLFFVFVVLGITIYQENKTERVLEALRDLSSPRALVIRDGEKQRIAGREVVPDDILLLSEGDRVPADARLLYAKAMQADESLLTGESVPVRKRAIREQEAAMAKPGGDDLPYVYSGSLVVQGQGIARVLRTGVQTEIGQIGKSLQQLQTEASPLQRQTRRLVRNLAAIGLALCVLVVVLYGLSRSDWLGGLLAGITLAMATLPEEFPVVLTVFMAIGAWRISRQRVLTRRIPAIETLGSATVLCVDKTGTLTENRMAVQALYAEGQTLSLEDRNTSNLPEHFHRLVEYAVLASEADPFDPMEKAFRVLAQHALSGTEHLHSDWQLAHEYALSPDMLAMTHVWKSRHSDNYIVAAKGAPEAIADLCHLAAGEKQQLESAVQKLSEQGLRVLGIAEAAFRGEQWPEIQHDFEFHLLGLIALADPLRDDVPQAVAECRHAGIQVAMITGDYPGTARAIAQQAGLGDGAILSGEALDGMSDEALRQSIERYTVFARIVPEQKLRIVQAFQANGEVVAMTGDGVNDAPALKAAHIGIAMGRRGTDVAREASALVLLEDDFGSIVQAVKLGRRIYDNLQKAMSYILAIHIPIAGLSLLPLLLGLPQIFWPVHIVFLELIIDPTCSVVFEAEREEADTMRRPPRSPGATLFGGWTLGLSLLQGLSVLAVVMTIYLLGLQRGLPVDEARALSFTSLVLANLALIFSNRSWSTTILHSITRRNAALWWVVGSTTLVLALVTLLSLPMSLFHFGALHLHDYLIALAGAALSVLWFEFLKAVVPGLRLRGSARP
jgi:Ca2+-transporting ATPase